MFRRLKLLAKRAAKLFGGLGPRSFLVGLRWAIMHGNPGSWSADHREQSQQITGWNYVAIKAKAIQGMQARVSVYQDAKSPQAKVLRQFVRKSAGRIPRTQWKSLYGRECDTATELSTTHPLVRLLQQPNRRQSGAHFRYECIQQLEATGTVLIWNVPNKLGRTVERHVIPTAMATPMPPEIGLPYGGWRIDPGASRFSFPIRDPEGFVQSFGYFRAVGAVIPSEPCDLEGEMMTDGEGNALGYIQAIRWPHPIFKDDGYSPLEAIALWSDLGVQIDRSRWASMKNQSTPSLIVSPDSELEPTPEELDAASLKFNEKYAGSENAGKAIFLSGKAEITQLGQAAKDMDYGPGFEQTGQAIMAGHGTPPIAAGAAGSGTYAGYYAALKQFTELTVQPILDFLAEEDTERLAPQFGEGLTIEYEAAAIDDPAVLEQRLATDISAGNALMVDEYRALRGLPPLGGAEGRAFVGATPAPNAEQSTGCDHHADESTTGITSGMRRPQRSLSRPSRNGHRRWEGVTR
jgi:phage portal protein BeeE